MAYTLPMLESIIMNCCYYYHYYYLFAPTIVVVFITHIIIETIIAIHCYSVS